MPEQKVGEVYIIPEKEARSLAECPWENAADLFLELELWRRQSGSPPSYYITPQMRRDARLARERREAQAASLLS